jgi:hypothetical protein
VLRTTNGYLSLGAFAVIVHQLLWGRPWGGMPGGAIGCLLPRSVAQYLETRALGRIWGLG